MAVLHWRTQCVQTGVREVSERHGGDWPLQVEVLFHLSGKPEACPCLFHAPGLAEDKE